MRSWTSGALARLTQNRLESGLDQEVRTATVGRPVDRVAWSARSSGWAPGWHGGRAVTCAGLLPGTATPISPLRPRATSPYSPFQRMAILALLYDQKVIVSIDGTVSHGVDPVRPGIWARLRDSLRGATRPNRGIPSILANTCGDAILHDREVRRWGGPPGAVVSALRGPDAWGGPRFLPRAHPSGEGGFGGYWAPQLWRAGVREFRSWPWVDLRRSGLEGPRG